jgi:hypothetical protein
VGTRLAVSGLIALLVAGRLVGMYLRTTRRKNRDGSVVRYVQLAHNRRVDGVTQAQVLLNLGREDQLDRDGVQRLVTSINRYLGLAEATPPEAVQLVGDGLTVAGSRPVGAVHLLDGLWRVLEIDTALCKVLGPRRFTTNVERVCFALVANRAIAPMSKLSAAEWASCDVAIRRVGGDGRGPGLPGDGPAGGSRRAGRGAGSGVFHRGQPAQSRGQIAGLLEAIPNDESEHPPE